MKKLHVFQHWLVFWPFPQVLLLLAPLPLLVATRRATLRA